MRDSEQGNYPTRFSILRLLESSDGLPNSCTQRRALVEIHSLVRCSESFGTRVYSDSVNGLFVLTSEIVDHSPLRFS